jgi:hypothetical protein
LTLGFVSDFDIRILDLNLRQSQRFKGGDDENRDEDGDEDGSE